MAERIVDLLEVIEIEAQDREAIMDTPDLADRGFDPFGEKHTVGSPVSASCRAMKTMRSSARRRSVASS